MTEELDIFKLDHCNRPFAFRIAIVNYTATKVFCWGYFRKPTEDEIRRHHPLPFAMFQPADPHGWGITFYSMDEVLDCIQNEGVPNYAERLHPHI